MLMFIVLTGELASWRVAEVSSTSYNWKEGCGEDSGSRKRHQRKDEKKAN